MIDKTVQAIGGVQTEARGPGVGWEGQKDRRPAISTSEEVRTNRSARDTGGVKGKGEGMALPLGTRVGEPGNSTSEAARTKEGIGYRGKVVIGAETVDRW